MIRSILIFFITYFYIPFKWIFRQKSKSKIKLDLSALSNTSNQVIILTGGTGGLGSNILKRLLQLKIHVVAGVRNLDTMREIISELEEDDIDGSVDIYPLDLESLESVKAFCDKVLLSGLPINGIINAAAVMGIPYKLTLDGYEIQFQVNYLSHFLLTNLLLPRIIESSTTAQPGVIINISSFTSYYGKLNFEILNRKEKLNKWQAYYNTKLYQVLFSHYLGIKMKQRRTNVRVNSIHPGFMETSLWRNFPCNCRVFAKIWGTLLGNPASGADEVIHVAFRPEMFDYTGEFFMLHDVKSKVPKVQWVKMEELWDLSCKLVKTQNIFEIERGERVLNSNPNLEKAINDSFIDILPIVAMTTLSSWTNNDGSTNDNSTVTPIDISTTSTLAGSMPIGLTSSPISSRMFHQ